MSVENVKSMDDERAFLEPETVEETTEEVVEEAEEVVEEEEVEEEVEEDEPAKEAVEEDDETDEELENDSIYQQLKKYDPKVLKEIPELRSVIFAEQEYRRVFPSVEDAKAAAEAAEVFAQYERDLTSGDSSNILEALEKTGKDSLKNFVANLIPTIEKQSKDLYFGMLYPEFKKMLRAAAKSGDERLAVSAKNLNWFVFGNTDVDSDADGALKPTKRDEREDAISRKEREFEERIFNSFSTDVSKSAETRAKRIISSAFKDSGISPLISSALTDKIFEKVDDTIAKDSRHMGNINNLWSQAKRAGFTTEWKDRITSAYLSRAKVLIPKIRQSVLAEAKINAKAGTSINKKPVRIVPSGTTQKSSGKVDIKSVDWDKTSEADFLSGKIVYKVK